MRLSSGQDCTTESRLVYHLEEGSLAVVVVMIMTTTIHPHHTVLMEALTARNLTRHLTGLLHRQTQPTKNNSHHKDNKAGALDSGQVLQLVLQSELRHGISLLTEDYSNQLNKNRVRLEDGPMLQTIGSVVVVAMDGVLDRRWGKDQEVQAVRRRVLDLVIHRIDTRVLDLVARVGGSENELGSQPENHKQEVETVRADIISTLTYTVHSLPHDSRLSFLSTQLSTST